MHIALITRVFIPGYGGLESVQGHLARWLVERGCRITVYAEKWAQPLPDGISVLSVHPSANKLLHKTVRYTQALQRQIPSDEFDCILANTPYFPCDIHRAGGGINHFWYDMKPVVYGPAYRLINRLPKYRSALELERRIYRPDNVRLQVANSRLVKRQMIDGFSYPADRIQVVYNGIDFKTFDLQWRLSNRARLRQDMNLSASKLAVLFVSNNHKRKGLSGLLEAVRSARLTGHIEVLVVGRGRKIRTDVPVRYVGHTDRIRDYYAAVDAMALPTFYEPCANVILEAMACGLPVMTTSLNGAAEFIDHRQNGLILAHGNDVHGIAEGLVHWLENPQDARDMGLKGRAAVEGLTWDRCARQIYQLCEQAASRRSSG